MSGFSADARARHSLKSWMRSASSARGSRIVNNNRNKHGSKGEGVGRKRKTQFKKNHNEQINEK